MAICVPNVAIKGGTCKREIIKPLTTPKANPTTKAANNATIIGDPAIPGYITPEASALCKKTAATTDVIPTIRPADKSVPRIISGPEIPKAIIKRTETLAKIFFKLLKLKKLLVLKAV